MDMEKLEFTKLTQHDVGLHFYVIGMLTPPHDISQITAEKANRHAAKLDEMKDRLIKTFGENNAGN